MSNGETSRDYFLSEHGSRLYSISREEFDTHSHAAVQAHELQPGEIYTAHLTSRFFDMAGLALRCEASIEAIGQPYTPFARAAFNLLLLDDMLRVTSRHGAEIDSLGSWYVMDTERPIHVYHPNSQRPVDTMRKGFLTLRADDPSDPLFSSAARRTNTDDILPLLEQGSEHPLSTRQGILFIAPENKYEHN